MGTVAGDANCGWRRQKMLVCMATIRALSIVVGVHVAVSNMEVFSAATELQQRVRFALL